MRDNMVVILNEIVSHDMGDIVIVTDKFLFSHVDGKAELTLSLTDKKEVVK